MSAPIPSFALSPINLRSSEWADSNQTGKVFISSSRSQRYRRVATPRRCRNRPIISAAPSRQPPDEDGYQQMEDFFGPSGGKFLKKRDQPRNDPSKSKVTSGSDMDVRDEPAQSTESRKVSDPDAYKDMAGIFGPPSSRFQKKNQSSNAPPSKKKVSNSPKEGAAAPKKPAISSQDLPQTPEDEFSDEDIDEELSPQDLAAQYEEMSQLLGPPTGRFRRQVEKGNPQRKENSPRNDSDTETQRKEEEEPVMRQVANAQEEFELLRSALRGGEKSNKPRSGRRQTPEEYRLEGIITDPYRTSYNLMPMKGLKKKRGPPRKGQKPLTIPKGYVFAIESIMQSYWALERVLDEEEKDWQEEQESLRRIELEKQEAKEERRRVRRGEPPTDAATKDESTVSAKKAKKGKYEGMKGIFGVEIINSLEKPVSKTRRVRTTTKAAGSGKSTVAGAPPNVPPTKPKSAARKARSKVPGVLLLRNPKLIA